MQAIEHQTKALDDRKRTPAVGHDDGSVETQLLVWRQPVTEGLTREYSSSTDVSPADVELPPLALLPSAHFPERPELRSMQTRESYESAMQKKS